MTVNWHPTGDMTEVSSSRYESMDKRFEERLQAAVQNQNHLWIVLVTHYASDQALDSMSGEGEELPILDYETIAIPPGVVCYICEESYEPRIRNYKCKGMA